MYDILVGIIQQTEIHFNYKYFKWIYINILV